MSLSRSTCSMRAIRVLRSGQSDDNAAPAWRRVGASIVGSAQNLIFFEPADHPVPAVLGRLFAIARAIVGDESVRRAGIGVEFGGLAAGLERGLHLMDLIDGDAGIGLAVEPEHRLLNLRRKIDRALRRRIALVGERAIERDAGFQIWTMRGVMPNIAAAAAEAHDAEPVGVAALRFGPGDGGIQIS